jgi:hypothetical protein
VDARVNVRGLGELQRDFRKMSKDLDKDLVKQLKEAADPVKVEAKSLALTEIRNMVYSPRWAGMRIGVTGARDLVYMVPSAKGRGGRSRSNLSGLLFDKAMEPALERHEEDVIERIDQYLGNLGDEYGF